MATVTVSTKGQVVLPLEVRRKLGLVPGTRVEVDLLPGGEAATIRPVRRKGKAMRVEDCIGILPNTVGSVPVEEFNERISQAFREGKL